MNEPPFTRADYPGHLAGLESWTRAIIAPPPQHHPAKLFRAVDRSPHGEAFTRWRLRLRLTLAAVAFRVGASRPAVTEWGKRAIPQRRFWPALRAIGFDPEPFAQTLPRIDSTTTPRAVREAFATALVDWLRDTGRSMAGLARETDSDVGCVRDWLKARSYPRPAKLERLRAIGAPVDVEPMAVAA